MSFDSLIKKDILITTPLEATWGNKKKNILLLGLWCKTPDNLDLYEEKDYEIHNYHRDDPSNLPRDYKYLEALFERVIIKLAKTLNQYHSTDHPIRFWRIIIGPWLLTYIPIIWDRWETLETAFQKYSFDETLVLDLDKNRMIPQDFSEFNKIVSDDLWNHFILSEIIISRYSNDTDIKSVSFLKDYTLGKKLGSSQSIKSKLYYFSDWLFSKIQKNYRVIFVDSYFNFSTLFKISFKLRQLPRMHYEFLKSINYDSSTNNRSDLTIDICPENDFESYLQSVLFSQIPIAYLEGFTNLEAAASKISSKGKIIFTANAHISNDLFNYFSAKHVNNGGTLIVSQHGGALKSDNGNIFNHQESIADAMTVWHKPFLKQHKQLSPSKLIGLNSKVNMRADYLSLIGFETSNYSCRIQASPVASSYKKDYDQKIEFAKQLSEDVFPHLLIQARNQGKGRTNSRDLYSSDLGTNKISSYSTAIELYDYSRVIVCTYPMTTFSEAMQLDIPTILLYVEDYWSVHPQFDDLIQELKKNNIIFSDPKAAARHINNIWNAPEDWWHSDPTLSVKDYFHDMCGRVSDNPVDEWVDYFKSNSL
jgi:putative transferase (TIGR04331 family)